MMKFLYLILGFSSIVLCCKAAREPAPMEPVITDPQGTKPVTPVTPSETTEAKKAEESSDASPESVDLCVTRPDLYRRENGQCVRIPLPSVEGSLKITSGLIWKPDLTRCLSPSFDSGFKFCSGGVHATIPLSLPERGTGKVRFSLSFTCKSFPPGNALVLTVGSESKLTLTSVSTDTPIFSSEIPADSGTEKAIRLDFTPNYSATYPASCQLILLENKVVQGQG